MNDTFNVTWPGWEIVRKIGKGSFGTVYEIQRDVYGDIEKAALKVIVIPHSEDEVDYLRCTGLDDASITQTFHQQVGDIAKEYKLMVQMRDNPNVVRCDDFRDIQHDDGLGWDIYIKMELLTPLMKSLDKVSTEEQIIKLAKDICNALITCQEKNIIHRDIKPQNVFIADNGNFKLGDFGIARTIERTTHATAGIGTYSYMAPEVEKSEPYGKTADIYSLGLMVYWLLNERRAPFMPLPPDTPKYGDEEKARQRRFSGEPLPPPKHGSKELKEIVLKACAYDPKDRYQTAHEMLDALGAITDSVIPLPLPEPDPLPAPDPPAPDPPTLIPNEEFVDDPEPIEYDPSGKTVGPVWDIIEDDPSGKTVGPVFDVPEPTPHPTPEPRPLPTPTPEPTPTLIPEPPEPVQSQPWRKGVTKVWIGLIIFAVICFTLAFIDANRAFGSENVLHVIHTCVTVRYNDVEHWNLCWCGKTIGDHIRHENTWQSFSSLDHRQKCECGYTKLVPHSYGSWQIEKEPTATSTGTKIRQCTVCGYTVHEELVLNIKIDAHRWSNTAVLKINGTVVAIGENTYGECNVQDWKDIVEISTGCLHTVGLKSDGTVIATGNNTYGQCNVEEWSNIIAIAAGRFCTLGLMSNGKVVLAGNYDYGEEVSAWNDIIKISVGDYDCTIGLKADGTAIATGNNIHGQCDVYNWKYLIQISASGDHSVGLQSNGIVVATGVNRYGQCNVSQWKGIVAISAGGEHTVGLKTDGTVVAVGNNNSGQCNVSKWKDIVAISAGFRHTIGLKSDGTVVAVGSNDYGQCDVSAFN